MSKRIWESLEIGAVRIKNRIVMPPMCTRLANPDGSVSPQLIAYYEARARGGVGMIIIEYSYIDEIASKAAICQLGVYKDDLIPGLNELVERLHYYDVGVFLQICHGGGRCPSSLIRRKPVAPSSVPFTSGEIPSELTIEEIKQILEAFGDAALRAKRAGFDGVEIHGAHGYLINEFLSPINNKRQDKYGPDFVSRTKFPLEVLSNVKQRVGSNFPVGYRLSVKDYVPGGIEFEETLELIKMLEKNGASYIHASAGTYLTSQYTISPVYIERGHLERLAMRCKSEVTIPIISVGGINHEVGIGILENDSADLVAMGRALIADPELPTKLKIGRPDEIRPCIRCNEGCIGRFQEGKTMRCATNPVTGREKDFILQATTTPKKVVIIGGGVAGMEVARIAKQRGHDVTIIEKGSHLGGNVSVAAVPAFKKDLSNLLNWYENQMNRLKININLNSDATPGSVKKLNPDVVILATGAEYFVPDIEGMRNEKVVTATDALKETKQIGNNIVIIGGGLVGVETALYINDKFPDKQITLLEMLSEILSDVVRVNKMGAIEKLQQTGIKIVISAKVERITEIGVEYIGKDNRRQTLPSDTVVLAAGFAPKIEFERSFRDIAPETYIVGDCRKPGKIMDAIDHAAIIASRI